jgi:hypothetical protein
VGIVIGLLGYFALTLVSVALLIRLRPEWFFYATVTKSKNRNEPPSIVYEEINDFWALPGLFAPVALLVCYPMSAILRASKRSVNEKIATRVALEIELAKAKQEIDELLRKDAA